jgi:hypothetical protein
MCRMCCHICRLHRAACAFQERLAQVCIFASGCSYSQLDQQHQASEFKKCFSIYIYNKPSYFLLRRNLQRHIKGLAPLSEDQFDAAISASGHISASSSISGSDRDSDEISSVGSDENGAHSESSEVTRNLSHIVVRHPKGELFVCWSTLFDVSDDGDSSRQPAFWSQPTAVILCSGGHFAATIFDRHSVAKSKTFHRYVVRAKQV